MGEPEPNQRTSDTPPADRRGAISARARADGAAGAPARADGEWSAAEREVIDSLEAQVGAARQAREALAAEVEHELRRGMPPAPDFEAPCAQARVSLRLAAGRLSPVYRDLAARAARTASELEGFRRANNLRRPAIYPDSRVLQAGMMLLAALFEALFSAALFAETDARGLLGGAVTAAGLSGANVALGFLSGFLGLRYIGHARPLARVLGGGGLALIGGLSVALNLFAAHWRDGLGAVGKTPADLMNEASLFGLVSPQAVILLMLGAGVWVFSALKGYSGFDDPYPDYGKFDRAAQQAADALSETRAEVRSTMEAPVQAAHGAIDARLTQMRADVDRGRQTYDRVAAELQQIDAAARLAGEEGGALIQLYRRENLAARNGAAAPTYFADAPPTRVTFSDVLSGAADLRLAADRALADSEAAAAAKLEALGQELETLMAQMDRAP
ncbi:MAG: hypothetical protein ABUS57_20660 [Pseudomonadota bacterium]